MEFSLAQTTPFQTMEYARTLAASLPAFASPTRTSYNTADTGTFNQSLKGGVRDPNNYVGSISLHNSPNNTRSSSPSSALKNDTNGRNGSAVGSSRSTTPGSPSSPTATSNPNKKFYHWNDFQVGIDVIFCGRLYSIVDADTFTREFYRSQGIELNPATPLPPSLVATPVAPNTRYDIRTCEVNINLLLSL